MNIIKIFAPAKVNLTLHVTGLRSDGYHLLDSLVMFANVGDRLTIMPSAQNTLSVVGPRASGVPTDASNLVLRAANLCNVTADITLAKYLPAAAGIGGGSSDAAATLLGLAEMAGSNALPAEIDSLGADLRVCLIRQAARMRGIGEDIQQLNDLPPVFAVLCNPGVEVSTPAIFKALARKKNPPMPSKLPRHKSAKSLISWLKTQRNDLEEPAIAVSPVIASVLRELEALPNAQLARMSGSGASCFALFLDEAAASQAAIKLRAQQPHWWVEPCKFS